jgi:hypothetical protein
MCDIHGVQVLGGVLSKALTKMLTSTSTSTLRLPVDAARLQYSMAMLIREFEYDHEVPSLRKNEGEAVVLLLLLLLRHRLQPLGEWLSQVEILKTWKFSKCQLATKLTVVGLL